MKAELIPADGGPPIPITKDVTILGRREFCDIQIDHPSLSKRHCILVKTEGLLVIRDLATTNGTKVKGQKIRWAALLPEDRIALGSIKFRVYLGPDNSPSPSEVASKRGYSEDEFALSFAAPTPLPGPSVVKSKAVVNPMDDDDLPLILDAGAWREAASMEHDDEDIIDLD